MDAFKSLVIGWSIVWAACLIGYSKLSLGGTPMVIHAFPDIVGKSIFLIPLIAFGVWAIGCGLIAAVCLLVSKLTTHNK